MDFELDQDERLLQEAARRAVAKDVEPVLAAHPPDRPLPKEAMLALHRVALTMPDGTRQIQQLIVGRELVGLRAFS